METEENPNLTERDALWLEARLQRIWNAHFSDVAQGCPIVIIYGREAKRRLGSIGARNGRSLIRINALFAYHEVPEYVVDGVIAHELAHYIHGFGSDLPRQYAKPHQGGVVTQELAKRGLATLDAQTDAWIKANWEAFCKARTETETLGESIADKAWNVFLKSSNCRTQAELEAQFRKLHTRFGLPADDPICAIEWLRASRRQEGLSYWFAQERVLRLHGLLADRRVPEIVLDIEIGLWIARHLVGTNQQRMMARMKQAKLEALLPQAMQWRQRQWTRFRNQNHPLG